MRVSGPSGRSGRKACGSRDVTGTNVPRTQDQGRETPQTLNPLKQIWAAYAIPPVSGGGWVHVRAHTISARERRRLCTLPLLTNLQYAPLRADLSWGYYLWQ